MRALSLLSLLSLGLAILALPTRAAPREVIDTRVRAALETFVDEVAGAEEFLAAAHGALVFPSVKKGALVVGGSYGEGALIVDDQIERYYSLAGASFGLQIGGQATQQILLFMTEQALQEFRASDGGDGGGEGDVTVFGRSAGTRITTKTTDKPILAFIFGGEGLLAGVDITGNNISPIQR